MNELQTTISNIDFWTDSAVYHMQYTGINDGQRSLRVVNWLIDDILYATRKADGWNWEAK